MSLSVADTDEDDVSLARVLRDELVAQYVPCSSFLGDNTRRNTVFELGRHVSNLPAGHSVSNHPK